ncbi:type IX secretion system sortase PorU [Portibacter lacus]|uniref:Peptidase C25 n=1 Tax=Portibacter lacus TaxID=1099794 RepID=A0AA37SX70_9BACT|nr:type IX secretion system sortase PorU [Portibacter lacus]GLR19355.1 peptidase C25 [Portibacter lacus]
MKLINTFLLVILFSIVYQFDISAQTIVTKKINWSKSTEIPENDLTAYSFDRSSINQENNLHIYSDQFPVNKYGDIQFEIIGYQSEETSITTKTNIPTSISVNSHIAQERRNYNAIYSFIPFIKNNNTGKIERITEIKLQYNTTSNNLSNFRGGPEFKNSSILKDGKIYKIAVSESGIYKISKDDLDKLGIESDGINPKKIQILGNPNGMNPEENSADIYDDLIENSIFIQGEADGSFDNSDFILFYAHGPHTWNPEDNYTHNIYDDNNYYFIKIGSVDGKRVQNKQNITGNNTFSSNYNTYRRYEKDVYNLLGDFSSTQGSGKLWFSEIYSSNRNQDFTSYFADPNLDTNEDVSVEIQFAARDRISSKLNLKIDGVTNSINFNGVNVSNIESKYADLEKKVFTQKLSSTSPEIFLDFGVSSNEPTGWLDYIQLTYSAKLNYSGQPIVFRKTESKDLSLYGFNINTTLFGMQIWDISNPENVLNQEHENFKFSYVPNGINEFVVFNPTAEHKKVSIIGEIENQNLHAIQSADLVIIYHPDFQEAAEKLAMHRADFSNLNVVAVSVNQIYNEFSSGRVDVPGIRNFAKMIYERDPNFKYLCLIGDGSFDYKHINASAYGDDSFIPVYETSESLSPIRAFPSDDFYALLNDQEGGNLKGGLDLGVGRIPVRTADEANQIIDKIINYDTNLDTYADWRLRIGFSADDEDNNYHVRDADGIAEAARLKYENFNVEKMYFDAYPQVSTPGGERYPLATDALNNNIFKGMLTMCYLGHGGPTGWAQERVLKLEDIEKFDNENKLPLFITATCSFTGYDNPAGPSAGEKLFLKEKTGAIALMSTVRAVYVNQNERLTRAVFDTIFTKDAGEFMGIGEILRRAKNSNAADTLDVNARKFQLIGDPALKLSIPEHQIKTTSINGVTIDSDYTADTIKALQKMTFEGFVAGEDGNIMSDFNGVVYTSVFDKVIQAKTLANNTSSSERAFNLQKTILFKGQSVIENGKFKFEFYLPSDINFDYGNGKISLYAKSGNIDASGNFEDFIIGGSDPANADDNPPLVDVYLNTEDFAFGGISTSNPVLLVKLQDDFGINVAGVSVGHDLVAELDNNSKERYILNDFYEAELNDFRKGIVRFPLKDLEPGKHTLKIKAWDLSNNLGEGYTEFFVTDDEGDQLEHVFNYPNPFSTNTLFQFEHNLPGTELEILINIYNVSGQIVKTIEHLVLDDGFRIDDISWDGRDDYGQKIANGVYLYKINVLANQLGIRKESNFEKLVILK